MNGLELSRSYFEEYGRPMLKEQFPQLLPFLAVGLVGSGSERFGFDDEISKDHDFEPGFCIFLPGEDVVDRHDEFLLSRAYSKLPKEFLGFSRQLISPVGGERNGVIRTADFYQAEVGAADGMLTNEQWLRISDHALAEAINGEIYFDNYGTFSAIREQIKNMPEDIRLKRIAGNLLLMDQAGRYNFPRCLSHGEPEAASLACHDYVNSAMKVFFLLCGSYMPYYKWSFRALRQLPGGQEFAKKLSLVLCADSRDRGIATQKQELISSIEAKLSKRLVAEGLSKAEGAELSRHAYSVNDSISDSNIRNLHILAAI